MTTIGLDLHKRESQLCILHEDGVLEERRINTSRDRFTTVLGALPRARILLESSTESEWVARHLEGLGHEVIVADELSLLERRLRRDLGEARRSAPCGRTAPHAAGRTSLRCMPHARVARRRTDVTHAP